MATNWAEKLAEMKQEAIKRLQELRAEENLIFSMFPELKPKRSIRLRGHYHGTHWTQKPENRDKVLGRVKVMQQAKGAHIHGD